MEQKILEALSQVDATNDEHWTADGAVRVDVVSELVGEEVSRADITAVAPKFNRKNTELAPADSDVDTGNTVLEDDDKGEGEIKQEQPEFTNPWSQAAHTAREKVEQQVVDIEETKGAVAKLEAVRSALVGERAALDVKIQEVDNEIHRLSQLCKEPELSLKEQLDMVLASEAGEVEERHKRRMLIKELMGSDKSMLDGLDMLD